jgi:hypothetical protein
MMRHRLRTCQFIACLFGLTILKYGWIIYPPLGTIAALIHLAAFLTILIAAGTGRITNAKGRRTPTLRIDGFPFLDDNRAATLDEPVRLSRREVSGTRSSDSEYLAY